MRAMQGGENNTLSVTVIMKFNHILKCNHEVVMNTLRRLLHGTGHRHICQDLLGTPTYEERRVVKYVCKDIIKMFFECYYYIIMYLFPKSQ